MASKRNRRYPLAASLLLAAWLPLNASAAPPLSPAQFRYSIYSDSTAELFWDRTSNTSVRGYEISRNGEIQGVFDALSHLDSTLLPGTEYTFSITAVGTDGERSEVSTISLVTPQSADTIATLQREVSMLEADILSLETLFNEGYLSPVPQTGMRISNRLGDDGDIQAGLPWPEPRFTHNVNESVDLNENGICDENENCNGTVTDQLTGLVWLQNASCFSDGDWSSSIDNANSLAGDSNSGCGLSDDSQAGDWRMPNIREMQSLVDYGRSYPDEFTSTGHPFINVEGERYWTSTSLGPDGSDGAYALNDQGSVERLSTDATDFTGYVWPVRNRQ